MRDPVVSVSDTAPAGWSELVAEDPHADFFHTEIWTRAVCGHLPQRRPLWLVAHSSGRLVGGLAAIRSRRRLGPAPWIQHIESHFEGTAGGPILVPDLTSELRERVCRALLTALVPPATGGLSSVAVALNPEHEELVGRLFAAEAGWVRRDDPTASIRLVEGLEHVEMQLMAKNKRNERNRGLRRGATFCITCEPDLLAGFHRLYCDACSIWGRSPVPLAFIQDLATNSAGAAFLTCVQLDGKVIGGHLNLHHGDRVVAWLGATDPVYARTHFPATVAVWGDLVEACTRGAAWLDLGGSGGIQTLSGFKKYLGATVRSRGYYLRESRPIGWLRRSSGLLRGLKRSLTASTRRVHDNDGDREPSS